MRKLPIVLVLAVAVAACIPFYQQLTGKPATSKAPEPTATSLPLPTLIPTLAPTVTPQAPKATQVELSDQEVTDLLRRGLAARGYQVDDLNVRIEEGRFVATTTQQMAFFRVPVTIVGEAGMVDGQIQVHPVSVTAGGAAVPQDVIDQMSATMSKELAAGIDGLPLRADSIELKPGQLIVRGVPR